MNSVPLENKLLLCLSGKQIQRATDVCNKHGMMRLAIILVIGVFPNKFLIRLVHFVIKSYSQGDNQAADERMGQVKPDRVHYGNYLRR